MPERPAHYRTKPREGLTPRQEEVLRLIAKGRSNGQIAEQLGISLETVKFHVSEILSRLEVESREEAVRAWRERESGARRAIGALLSASAFRWLAAGGAAVAGAGVIASIFFSRADDETAQPAPAATETVLTPTPPAPTSTPNPNVILGLPVRRLAAGSLIELPAGLVVYYSIRVENADGPGATMVRAYRDSTGTLWVDDLLRSLRVGDVYVDSLVMNVDAGSALAVVCSRGYCGGFGDATPDAQWSAFRSSDGGITWEPLGVVPPSWAHSVSGDRALVVSAPDEEGGPEAYFVLPGYERLRPPVGQEDLRPYADGRGGWAWLPPGQPADGLGRPLAAPTVPDAVNVLGWRSRVPGVQLVSWSSAEPEHPDALKRRFFGLFNASGEPLKIFESGSLPSPWLVLTDNLLIGGAGFKPGSGAEFHPALAVTDLTTGTQSIVAELSLQYPSNVGPQLHDALLMPQLARVNIPGDCLNIRVAPSLSGELVGCEAHGVLLWRTGRTENADGIEWVEVVSPRGSTGWSSRPFLLW